MDNKETASKESKSSTSTGYVKANRDKLRVGISIGDMNGVGIEVIIKTFSDNRMIDYCTPVIYGSSRAISYHRKVLSSDEFNYNIINSISEVKSNVTNVLNCWTEDISITIGKPSKELGNFAIRALEAALYDLHQGKIDALITAPVNKNLIQVNNKPFKGHTEYITAKVGVKESLMFLVNDNLRVGLVTNHLSVREIADAITSEKIEEKARIMDLSLRKDFGIVRPKIAVLALNPHAGDSGLLGKEEIEIIEPTIKKLSKDNLLVFGPYSADGFFGSGLHQQFDGILAMYHDQGLVPFKTLSFGEGVNFTAGLPIVRTSPDHGTAYDIAGKGVANPNSFRKSVYLALDVIRNRRNYAEMTENPLDKSSFRTTPERKY